MVLVVFLKLGGNGFAMSLPYPKVNRIACDVEVRIKRSLLQEVDEFLADTRPDAYERRVDQARDADHDSSRRDEPRQIYKYRRWVIDALNKDLPFDQFVVEKLAARRPEAQKASAGEE